MVRSYLTGSERPRQSGPRHVHYGPVMWILLLLAFWFLIAEWKMLPEVVGSTLAALP